MIDAGQVIFIIMATVVLPYAMCRAHGVPFTKILPLVVGMVVMAMVIVFTVKGGSMIEFCLMMTYVIPWLAAAMLVVCVFMAIYSHSRRKRKLKQGLEYLQLEEMKENTAAIIAANQHFLDTGEDLTKEDIQLRSCSTFSEYLCYISEVNRKL
uniref:Uncharacterized protein n=1 Tax=Serratia phage Kevin TaxID=3161161 RepID=A0AAU8KZ06_9CAUD